MPGAKFLSRRQSNLEISRHDRRRVFGGVPAAAEYRRLLAGPYQGSSKVGRANGNLLFEAVGKLTLIVKAGRAGNRSDSFIALSQTFCGPINTEPPDVITNGSLVVPTERTCQMRRVDPNRARNLKKVERVIEVRMAKISRHL